MMSKRVGAVLCGVLIGCGSVPSNSHDDSGVPTDATPGSDAQSDAPVDAPPKAIRIAATPSTFVLHVNETRDTTLTVTNDTDEAIGTPDVQVSGLTLGTITFLSNTCTAGLAPGASCTTKARLTATSAGQITFNVTVTATPGGGAMDSLSLTAMAACPATCGAAATTNCCDSSIVPGNAAGATMAGASFYRSYDVAADAKYASMSYPATVSDFRLDKYEVTVGRFRAFVNAGMGTQAQPPTNGAGAHPGVPASGWNGNWNTSLVADTTALKTALKCDATYQTWTDTAGANESLPITCVTWYEAMAFCIWDGGYLPTETEWNYAAAGGSEQRAYPWSPPASPGSLTIDCSYANYRVNGSSTYCVNGATGGVNRVGSESPKGDGKWGHSDLGGNVQEWVLDGTSNSYQAPCDDCVGPVPGYCLRGGSFQSGAGSSIGAQPLRTGDRDLFWQSPSQRGTSAALGFGAFGFRCARMP